MTAESDFIHKMCDERMEGADIPTLKAEKAALQTENTALKARIIQLEERIADLEAAALKHTGQQPPK